MFALTFAPSSARQPRIENSKVEGTVTLYGDNSDKPIAHIRFDRENCRVGGCGMVVLLSREYKKPEQVQNIEQFVTKYFAGFGQISTFELGQKIVPFSIDVPYYAARIVLDSLFRQGRVPDSKREILLKWVTSLEEYGTCAENLNCLTSNIPKVDAILDGIINHLQRIECRKTRCDITDVVYVCLEKAPQDVWGPFFRAFQQVALNRLLRVITFASKEETHYFPQISRWLTAISDENLDVVMNTTDALLEKVKSRITFMENTIFGIHALLLEGQNDAVDFLLNTLKGKTHGELVTNTIGIIRHAKSQKAARALITQLFKAEPKERNKAVKDLFTLVVPNDQPVPALEKPARFRYNDEEQEALRMDLLSMSLDTKSSI